MRAHHMLSHTFLKACPQQPRLISSGGSNQGASATQRAVPRPALHSLAQVIPRVSNSDDHGSSLLCAQAHGEGRIERDPEEGRADEDLD